MNAESKTLYIPLYSRSFVSKKGIILSDKKAEEIWGSAGIELSKKSKSKWLSYYLAMRSRVIDDWTRAQMDDHTEAVVLHIGCGLDSRIERVGSSHHPWYDIDLPPVIEERSKFYRQTIDYSMIEADATDDKWLNIMPHDKNAIIIMEGISMYIETEAFKALLKRLCDHFEKLHLIVDCYTDFAAKHSEHRNPISEFDVQNVYGINRPEILTEETGLTFVKEHDITPDYLSKELKGFERFIFKNVYGGAISKRLYRMYEYIK